MANSQARMINPGQLEAGQRVRIIIDTTVEGVHTYNQDDYPVDVRQRVDVLYAGRHTLELPDLTSAAGTTIAVLVQP